jgi:SpoVK/Ycf46/Vps4 family AAA+-type ATPase
MAVRRISNINVKNNVHLFTAVYGNIGNNEMFIDSDLKGYTLNQQLYLYLKSEGYTVLFYDQAQDFNIHSFSRNDIQKFISDYQANNPQKKRYVARNINSPFKQGRLNRTNTNNTDTAGNGYTIQEITLTGKPSDTIYRTNRTSGIIDDLKRLFGNTDPNKKVAYIVCNVENCDFGDFAQSYTAFFRALSNAYAINNSKHKIFLLYNYPDKHSLEEALNSPINFSKFFYGNTYQQMFLQEGELKSDNSFCISLPDKEEIANLLNYRRLTEGFDAFTQIPFDKLVIRLLRKRALLKDLKICDISKEIEAQAQEKSAKETLQSLIGIDSVFKQLEKQVKLMKKNKQSKTKTKIRPHLVFKGNPGTGKTTVARLFAEWLQEEGILEIGNLVETDRSGLVAGHVGQTAIKTNNIIDSALGGILFIDEAYQLYSKSEVDFGREAIATLIKRMEDDKDKMVVILAGYTDEIDELLKNGNAGFQSRIGNQIVFQDYTPEVLLEIAKNNIKPREITEAAEKLISKYLCKRHRKRHKQWGNARVAEEIVQKIITELETADDEIIEIIDIEHIPADCQRIANPITDLSESDAYNKLNALIGLPSMKEEINSIFASIRADILREENNIETRPLDDKFNFVFIGNPGTGKTTVARILAEILFDLGILIEDKKVIECSAGEIVSSEVGQSAKNIKQKFEDSVGKVLFLDEVYSIRDQDAVDAIVQSLTNPDFMGKTVVIIAGYPEPVRKWLDTNEGLKSRFNKFINFDDYTNEELWQILESSIESYNFKINSNCKKKALQWFKTSRTNRDFANARTANKLFEEVLKPNLDKRVIADNINSDLLTTITAEDFPTSSAVENGKGIQKLNELIGLTQMKQTLENILTSIKADEIRAEKLGIESNKANLNFVFRGNPGTGKTTVARIMGEILCEYGLLNSSDVVECSRSQIIGQYSGQTAPKVRELFEGAKGKVLFFDEIYSLVTSEHDDFGKEAINEIVALMTSTEYQGQMAFVIAGYPHETNNFIAQNPGLHGRFNHYVDFEDYTNEELWQIYLLKSKSFNVGENCKDTAISWFESCPRSKNFKNARYAEDLLKITKDSLDKRITKLDLDNVEASVLNTILLQDFPNYGESNVERPLTQPQIQSTPHITIPSKPYFEKDSSIDNLATAMGLIIGDGHEGTGFLISPNGHLITCAHCVEDGEQVKFLHNGDEIETELIYKNKDIDIAILKIDRNDLPYFVITDSRKKLPRNTEMGLLSYPKGRNMGLETSFTKGVISKIEDGYYYTDANATHGSSGGAFFKIDDGVVYGVLNGGYGEEGGNMNLARDIRELFKQDGIKIEWEQ